jgi:hypothetical protein
MIQSRSRLLFYIYIDAPQLNILLYGSFDYSIFSLELDETRNFHGKVLELEERGSTPAFVHFNMYGSQLTLHKV